MHIYRLRDCCSQYTEITFIVFYICVHTPGAALNCRIITTLHSLYIYVNSLYIYYIVTVFKFKVLLHLLQYLNLLQVYHFTFITWLQYLHLCKQSLQLLHYNSIYLFHIISIFTFNTLLQSLHLLHDYNLYIYYMITVFTFTL